ncbi:hypothetical protein RAHE111665_16135 [Rariglobus hedericola]
MLTTRKHGLLGATLALAALALGGCSTPGPNHAYLARLAEEPIIDVLPGAPDVDIPTYLSGLQDLYGIAYDPFTDHLFLRIYPGDFIRVIDRPARKIKRSFVVKDLPPGPGDLAIRSSDRHLFFVHPTEPAVIETTLYGVIVRTITFENVQGSPAGVAYDQKRDQLLILQGGDLAHVGRYDLKGKRLSGVALDRNVRLVSLAYDSVAAEFYVPLLDEAAVGIFDAKGHFLRKLSTPDGTAHDFVDVGERSLIRMF